MKIATLQLYGYSNLKCIIKLGGLYESIENNAKNNAKYREQRAEVAEMNSHQTPKGTFTQAIFCRAIQCNFRRAKVETSKSRV